MGAIQPWHLGILLIVVLLIFGPGKLPDIGKAMGQTIREFRDATKTPDAGEAGADGTTGTPGAQPPVA